MAPPDTRTAPRVAAPNVMVRVSTAQRFRAVYLKDLSEGGLFIKTDRPIALGQKILVDLFPPGFTLPLRLPATVVRHATAPTAGMGVKFETMLPETSQALSTLVASYNTSVSAAAAPVNLVDASRDLEALTEQYSNLKTNYEVLAQELLTERERREEASQRALQMVSELESAKTSPDSSSISNAQIEELKAALAAAQSEAGATRLRLVEVEGNLASYAEEVQVLEADDAASRHLASVLAHEKQVLAKEVERLNAELAKERAQVQARLKDVEARGAQADSAAKEIAKAQQANLEARKTAAAEQASRQAAHAEELRALQSQNVAFAQKLELAEKASRDNAAKLERLKGKERELRKLLAVVSGREEDVVVMEEVEEAVGLDPAVPPPPPPDATEPENDNKVFAEPPPLPVIEKPEPPAGATALSASSVEVGDWDLPVEPLSEDVDLEVEPPIPAKAFNPLSRDDFEKRMRANDELTRTELFATHKTVEPIDLVVKELLEKGPRLSELMVLARGVATPPMLLEVLYRFHLEGLVTFR